MQLRSVSDVKARLGPLSRTGLTIPAEEIKLLLHTVISSIGNHVIRAIICFHFKDIIRYAYDDI